MLKSLMKRVRRRSDLDACHSRARSLLEYLEINGSLTLDKKGLAVLGLSRKQAFQTVYDLVLRESIQMRAEEDGRVIVMSNSAFAEHLKRRAREAKEERVENKLADDQYLDLALVAYGEENGMEPEYYAYSRHFLPARSREPWLAVENISCDFD